MTKNDYMDILLKNGISTENIAAALHEMIEGELDIDIVVGENGKIPTLATNGSGGYDLYAAEDVEVPEGRFKVSLDLKFSLPEGYAAIIKPRSGYTLKGMEVLGKDGEIKRVDIDAKDGVVDSDFRGIVAVMMVSNVSGYTIPKGERIAQMLIVRVRKARWHEVKFLDETERGGGAFGHSN